MAQDKIIDRSRWLPGDPWDAPAAGRGELGGRTREAAPPVIDPDNRRKTGGAPPVNLADSSPRALDAAHDTARDAGNRFVAGISGNPATQFRPGQSGNPAGRPKGSGRVGMRAAARLLDEQAELLAHKAIEMALAGDPVAVRFCLGRILGARRGQPVEFALPPIAERGDLKGAIGAIAAAVGEGSLTAEEAYTLSRMLEGTAYLLPRSPLRA